MEMEIDEKEKLEGRLRMQRDCKFLMGLMFEFMRRN